MRWLILIMSACILSAAAKTPSDQVRSWLTLVDAGSYEKSFDAAAAFFQKDMKRTQWVESMNGFRKPFGAVKKRTERSQTKKKNLPGAPSGDYIIFTFDTVFECGLAAVETVNTVREKDGIRICGYFIR